MAATIEPSPGTISAILIIVAIFSLIFFAYQHMTDFYPTTRQSTAQKPLAITSLARGTLKPVLSEDSTKPNSEQQRVHVIILVHGWIGCSQDLAYVHQALEVEAAKIVKEQNKDEPFYVYTCVSNNGRTNDGIQAGGDRIAAEIEDFLKDVKEQNEGATEISLSLVGYSLGGLYSRYALPQILKSADNLQGIKIKPKIFCTVATPHLGTKGHMWVLFPKFMEKFGLVNRTGRDLFHYTPLLKKTITDPYWTEPLLLFEKRIAYANTYAMDMMVPTSTAAFLSEHSDTEHFHQTSPSSLRSLDDEAETTNIPFIALVVETPPRHELLRETCSKSDEKLDMTSRLDAMGWTKVFVDFTDGYREPMKPSYTSSSLYSEFNCNKRHFSCQQDTILWWQTPRTYFRRMPINEDALWWTNWPRIWFWILQLAI